MHGLQAPWSQVTSARGLAETGSREGGEAAENYPDLLNHEWHHSRGTSARSADCVHNPGCTKPGVSSHHTLPDSNLTLASAHSWSRSPARASTSIRPQTRSVVLQFRPVGTCYG